MRARRPEYPQIVFRSKLEAQWSAVLDELGLTWEFEPWHFDLPSGMYVPDFLVGRGQANQFLIEVKGPWPNPRELEVASEVNLYYTPLLILSGDVPRQANGGTAWWFDPDLHRWSFIRVEEALRRMLWPLGADRPEELAGWEAALSDSRGAEIIKVEG